MLLAWSHCKVITTLVSRAFPKLAVDPKVEPATLTTADPRQVVERQIWDDQGKRKQNRSGKGKYKRPHRRAWRLWHLWIPAKWLKDTCGKSIGRERQRQNERQKQKQRYLYVPCKCELVLIFFRHKEFTKNIFGYILNQSHIIQQSIASVSNKGRQWSDKNA